MPERRRFQQTISFKDRLVAFARDSLGSIKAPKRVEVRASLPRTNAGKISRAELRRPFWEAVGRRI